MGKDNKKYKVFIGHSELEFTFDCYGDAIDFIAACLENGYRVTIIPFADEDGEDNTNADAIWKVSEELEAAVEKLQRLGELGLRGLREAVQETG